ncbi:MAG: hypothetical protein ABEI99_04105, partial [Halobaculum sp.]
RTALMPTTFPTATARHGDSIRDRSALHGTAKHPQPHRTAPRRPHASPTDSLSARGFAAC